MAPAKKNKSQHLRRRQLDATIAAEQRLSAPNCKNGYIHEFREALGMTATQLANRLGISQPAVSKLEQGERNGTITLNSLRRVAEALECDVIYSLVPKISLETSLRARARIVAAKIVGSVQHHMKLEDQATSTKEVERQIEEVADELVRNLDRRLWAEHF